jgi:hypothetical protein
MYGRPKRRSNGEDVILINELILPGTEKKLLTYSTSIFTGGGKNAIISIELQWLTTFCSIRSRKK